jgi:hypothetical protein
MTSSSKSSHSTNILVYLVLSIADDFVWLAPTDRLGTGHLSSLSPDYANIVLGLGIFMLLMLLIERSIRNGSRY